MLCELLETQALHHVVSCSIDSPPLMTIMTVNHATVDAIICPPPAWHRHPVLEAQMGRASGSRKNEDGMARAFLRSPQLLFHHHHSAVGQHPKCSGLVQGVVPMP